MTGATRAPGAAIPARMPSPPYKQPGADVAFWILFGLFAVGEYAMRFRSFVNRSGTRDERWSLQVVMLTAVGGILAAFGLASWKPTEITAGRWPLFVAGLVLMSGGIVVRQWAIIVLGRYFTADVRVHADQTVVERGPYRWVRHPSYSALVVFFAGVGLALSNWASLAMVVVLPTVGLVVRIRAEERALLAALGDPYERFASSRRRLVPGVW